MIINIIRAFDTASKHRYSVNRRPFKPQKIQHVTDLFDHRNNFGSI